MPRHFVCPSCLKPSVSTAKRGPLPKRCDICKMDGADADQAGWTPPPPTPIRSMPPPPSQRPADFTARTPKTLLSAVYQDRIGLALAMRLEHAPWEQIADQCGFDTVEAAALAVRHAMVRRQAMLDETMDNIRFQELQRLDRLSYDAMAVLQATHPMVSGGTVVTQLDAAGNPQQLADSGPVLRAIDTLIKLSESRRKLLGLDAATKVDAAVQVAYTIEGISEEAMP